MVRHFFPLFFSYRLAEVTRACRRESGSAFFCRRSGARYSRGMTCQFALFVPFVARLFTPIAFGKSLSLSFSSSFTDVCTCIYRWRRRERERERQKSPRPAGYARKERKRGSRGEWKRDGSIYQLLSSDASGITFVRFAGVDDVVARGVGVISTREGTYLPITVPSLFPSCAHIRTRIYSRRHSRLLPSFLFISLAIFPGFSFPDAALVREFCSGTPRLS